MKFLVDAQLPAHLISLLSQAGHDAIHVATLPRGSRSTDAEVAAAADEEDRLVVTKDRDFRDSHLLQGTPRCLLAVVTGNITNTALLALFTANLEQIVLAVEESRFVELGPTNLVVHDDRQAGL